MKIAIVYFSQTGNTEAMANKVKEALEGKADVEIFTSDSFDTSKVEEFDAFAFGCPAMGAEVLEEESFEPMFTSIETELAGKKVALFGSYGWGDGEWMRSWEQRCKDDGINVTSTVIANETPDEEAMKELENLASSLL